MKKEILTLILGLSLSNAHCQSKSHVLIDKQAKYFVKNEGKVYNNFSGDSEDNELTKAYLLVNGDTTRTIRSAKATMVGDALTIVIHENNPSYDHRYEIEISKGKYTIKYTFKTPGSEDEKREIVPVKEMLRLNTSTFKKGNAIRGYTEFSGECTGFCWDDTLFVKGNFSIVIE
jgi:flagellar basal body L-ring protein FlgH